MFVVQGTLSSISNSIAIIADIPAPTTAMVEVTEVEMAAVVAVEVAVEVEAAEVEAVVVEAVVVMTGDVR